MIRKKKEKDESIVMDWCDYLIFILIWIWPLSYKIMDQHIYGLNYLNYLNFFTNEKKIR